MSFYPQIGQGVVSQFPVRRTRKWRAITNELESGEQIILPDAAGGQIEWYLKYTDLSDTEATAIRNLFEASFGGWGPFVFVDPLANLLAWSEDLSKPDWQLGLIAQTPGANDPLGTRRAVSLVNTGAGGQQVSQSLPLPGDYVACFSAWIRSDTTGTVTMQRDGIQSTASIGPAWQRMYVSGAGSAGASQSTFSIALAAGQAVEAWGMQVEAQPYPSIYRQTSGELGIYEETYFANDDLTMASTAPGLSSGSVKLISRV